MRALTILRRKKYAACLARVRVYIEDSNSNDIVINKVHCRYLGTLKNGEEKTFEVTEEAVKVYVIGDRLSKDFCNDFYELPQGSEAVRLEGQNEFNPATGNAFRFDGVSGENVKTNRQKGALIGVVVLIVAVIVGSIIGSALVSDSDPKEFSAKDLSITLTDEFIKTTQDGYIACYGTEDVVVLISSESRSELENFTLYEYAEALGNIAGSTKAPVSNDGLLYIEYNARGASQEKFHYTGFVFMDETDFYVVTFATLDSDSDEYADQIMEWAKTVELK